jgi:hypothetical protein
MKTNKKATELLAKLAKERGNMSAERILEFEAAIPIYAELAELDYDSFSPKEQGEYLEKMLQVMPSSLLSELEDEEIKSLVTELKASKPKLKKSSKEEKEN